MAISEDKVVLEAAKLGAIQAELRTAGLDGWLLYDFHGNNPVSAGFLGLPVLSRRIFVLIPANGPPVALTHAIEQQPWEEWIGETRKYLSWESLHDGLISLLSGCRTVAAEISPLDAVPYLDRLPFGVVEILGEIGVTLRSSGDLVSAFHSRWDEPGHRSHVEAAGILQSVAHDAFARVGERLRGGGSINEWELREWVVGEIAGRGLKVGGDSIVAVNGNAANPHYAPGAARHSPIQAGDVLLIDLWGKREARSVYADQTWMASVGGPPSDRVQGLWEAIRDGRDAGVELIRRHWEEGRLAAGFEVDDAVRKVVTQRGYGDAFIHRTGHSIDRELHGSGPNIDNLETRDERSLIHGIGFSVEPGVYFPGEVGLRSEIDVYMSEDGPVVTTPEPQRELEIISI